MNFHEQYYELKKKENGFWSKNKHALEDVQLNKNYIPDYETKPKY